MVVGTHTLEPITLEPLLDLCLTLHLLTTIKEIHNIILSSLPPTLKGTKASNTNTALDIPPLTYRLMGIITSHMASAVIIRQGNRV